MKEEMKKKRKKKESCSVPSLTTQIGDQYTSFTEQYEKFSPESVCRFCNAAHLFVSMSKEEIMSNQSTL